MIVKDIKFKNLITDQADFYKITDLKNIILYQFDS